MERDISKWSSFFVETLNVNAVLITAPSTTWPNQTTKYAMTFPLFSPICVLHLQKWPGLLSWHLLYVYLVSLVLSSLHCPMCHCRQRSVCPVAVMPTVPLPATPNVPLTAMPSGNAQCGLGRGHIEHCRQWRIGHSRQWHNWHSLAFSSMA